MSQKNFSMKLLSSLLVLMIVFQSLQGLNLIGAYPEAEEQYRIRDAVSGVVTSQPFQDHQVFSNKTNCFYTFSSTGSTFYVTVTDLYGNVLLDDWIHRDLVIPYEYVDFSVAIDKYGEKIYLAYYTDNSAYYSYKDELYVDYLTIGDNATALWLLNTAEVTTYDNRDSRFVDITVMQNGYQVLTYGTKISAGNYGSGMSFSDSTTAWSNSGIWYHPEGIYNDKKGTNTDNDLHLMACSLYGTNGFSFYFRSYDTDNTNFDDEGILTCTNYTMALDKGGYAVDQESKDNFELLTSWTGDYTNNIYRFDLVGNPNNHCLAVKDFKSGGNSFLKYVYYNNSETITDYLHNITGTHAYTPTAFTNDRNSCNVLFTNDNWDSSYYYVAKYNHNTWSFNIPKYCFHAINTVTNTNVTLNDYMEFSTCTGYCPNIGYEKATIGGFIYEDTIEGGWFYLDEDGEIPNPYNYLKLNDEENNLADEYGIWILPDEKQEIEINVLENTTKVNVTMQDEKHDVVFNYDLESNTSDTIITHKNNKTVKEIAYIYDVERINYGNNVSLFFTVIFSNDLVDYYSDIIGYSAIYDNVTFTGLSSVRYSLFNLGKTDYDGSGCYNIYGDNDIFSIGACNNSDYAQFNSLYNKLEHMSFKVKFDLDADWDNSSGIFENATGGFFEYGMNYEIDDNFLNGWKVRIYPSSFVVGHQNAGNDFNYIQWTIEHYIYNRTTEDYQLDTTDFLYSNFNGYDEENANPSYHINNTNTDFWVHLWFSNDNGSRKVATRINSEYYGMYEQGSSWWFGYGDFRPMIGDKTESIYYNNLYDVNGSITQHTDINIVEFWGRVEKVTGGLHEYKMFNYMMKNKELAQDRMLGIDTPVLVETKVLDMPNTGFLSPLIRVIESIKTMIVNSLIYVLSSLSNVVDRLLVSIGLPPLMSIFYNVLVAIFNIFELIYDSFLNIVDWMVTSLTYFIESIFLVIPRYLYFVNMVVTVFIDYYNNIILLFTGGIGDMNNFWVEYSVSDWIQVWLIAIFPFIELERIESSDEPIQVIFNDAKLFSDFIKGVFDAVYYIFKLALDIIQRIVGVF